MTDVRSSAHILTVDDVIPVVASRELEVHPGAASRESYLWLTTNSEFGRPIHSTAEEKGLKANNVVRVSTRLRQLLLTKENYCQRIVNTGTAHQH